MKGPQGKYDLDFTEAIFGGPARQESRNWWIKKEGAEDVIVPNVSKFGEKNKATGEQGWEDVQPGSALQGLLLPQPPGKKYRLLKILTQPATPEQIAKLGNDRAPVVHPPKPPARLKLLIILDGNSQACFHDGMATEELENPAAHDGTVQYANRWSHKHS